MLENKVLFMSPWYWVPYMENTNFIQARRVAELTDAFSALHY